MIQVLLTDVASHVQSRMTMARTMKLYKLPDQPLTPGLRPMTRDDVPEASQPVSVPFDAPRPPITVFPALQNRALMIHPA